MPTSVIVQLPGVDRFFGFGPPDGLLLRLFSLRFLVVEGYPVDGAVSLCLESIARVFLSIPPHVFPWLFFFARIG